jgi:uncharacterized membrane protein YjdF
MFLKVFLQKNGKIAKLHHKWIPTQPWLGMQPLKFERATYYFIGFFKRTL